MTYSILPVVGITLSLTAIAGSVMAIPSYLPEDEIKNLNSIDISSLWTSKPSLVDPSKQNFERLPALVTELPKSADLTPAVDNIVASATQLSRKLSHPNLSGEGETASVGLPSSFQAGTEAAKWCAERYTSYRSSDNTFKPYSGARRRCEPSFASPPQNTVPAEVVEQDSHIGKIEYSGTIHAQWCFARYRSYNPGNNTYRAFSGEIRSCVSPYI